MPSFYKKHSLQSISLILLVALLCNAVVFNVLMRPKIARALGDEWATIGNFFSNIGEFLWKIGVQVKDLVWAELKDIWEKKIKSVDWWWERAKDAAQLIARKLQASLLTKITNNLADVIEGKNTLDGFKKYVEDFKKDIFWDAIAKATNQFSQDLAGIDLCNDLGLASKAEAKIVINPPLSDRLATIMSCSRKQMGQNLKNFYESFEGGWGSWLNVTQPNQNFAGSYLLALDAKIDLANKSTQANVTKVVANAGWRSNEQCDEWFISKLNLTFSRKSAVSGQLTTSLSNQPISVIDYLLRMYSDPPQLATFRLAAGVSVKQQEKEAKSTNLTIQADDATLCYNSCRGDNNLTPEGIASPDQCANPQGDRAGFCCYDKIKACRDAGLNEDVLLGNFLGAVCTKKSVKSPGQLIGQSFTKSVNWESDWLLSSTEVSAAISILANAAINRFMRVGVDAIGKAKTRIANIFGSDKNAVEANQAACRKRSVALDRNACLQCADVDPKLPEFQACFNNEKQKMMMAPALTGQINNNNLSADMTQIGLLNQAIELKEKVSRALQSMGEATYYANVRNPLQSMQYLAKCRWQTCASHDIRQFMIQHCIDPSDPNDAYNYDNLAMRCTLPSGVLNFGIPPISCRQDPWPHVGEATFFCSAKEENTCANALDTTLAARCFTECRHYDNDGNIIPNPTCENDCQNDKNISNPNGGSKNQSGAHKFNSYQGDKFFSPCLELSAREALGASNINTIYPAPDINTGAPYQDNPAVEQFTDPNWLSNNVSSQSGTCLSNAAWLYGNKNDDSANGDGGNIGRAKFYQKTPRFAGNLLVPGWWNYEQKITIEQKIKDLAVEIGQDSRLLQIYRDNICGTDSVCKNNFGVIDMSYEYADQCVTKCTGSKDVPACLTKCTQIDVFEKLTPTDITAMFTPFTPQAATTCDTHCANVKAVNSNIDEGSCKEFCKKELPLGLCGDAREEPALACTKSSRYSRLGSMRIQQWDVLDKQKQVNGEEAILEFAKNILEVCPANNVPPVDASDFHDDMAKYENNIIQKAVSEQELYANEGVKSAALVLANSMGKKIGNATYSYAKCDLKFGEQKNRDEFMAANIDFCPITQLWLNWAFHSLSATDAPSYSACDNYNPDSSLVARACPSGCKITFARNSTPLAFVSRIETYLDTARKTLAERSTQTISDGQTFSIDTSLIDELNSQLKFVNDNMDPRSLKQLNQNINEALDQEQCCARIAYPNDKIKDGKCVWPGSDYAGKD